MSAVIKYEYYSPLSNYSNKTQETRINGIISSKVTKLTFRDGQAFTLIDSYGNYDGCQQTVNISNYTNGIAIIQRGGNCTFSVKITRAIQYGASAVIIYDPRSTGQDVFDMVQNNTQILSIFVSRSIGSLLFNLTNDKRTYLNISLEPTNFDYNDSNQGLWYAAGGATIFIIVAICVLAFLCISWFIFYYCQRYRSHTTKNRLQDRLKHAAKKALTKIPLTTVTENSLIEESCVICLDTIKIGDTVRQLICGHTFHQHCVDPWLINHRHCPLCNLDILVAYRISIPGINNDHQSIVPENPIPISYITLATTAAAPISHLNNNYHDEQQQQQTAIVNTPLPYIPTISGSIKDDRNGEQNSSFRSDDEH